MAGTAHINVNPDFLERVRKMEGISILSEKDFGDGTIIAVISCERLSDGYHGMQEVFTWPDSPETLRFRREADT